MAETIQFKYIWWQSHWVIAWSRFEKDFYLYQGCQCFFYFCFFCFVFFFSTIFIQQHILHYTVSTNITNTCKTNTCNPYVSYIKFIWWRHICDCRKKKRPNSDKMTCAPSEDSDQLGICPVWAAYSLCAQWEAKDHADSEESNQTGRMPRLTWVFPGRTGHFVGFDVWRLICQFGRKMHWK